MSKLSLKLSLKLSVLRTLPLLAICACVNGQPVQNETRSNLPADVRAACIPYLEELRSSYEDNKIVDPDDPALRERITRPGPVFNSAPGNPAQDSNNAGVIGLAAVIEPDGTISRAKVIRPSGQQALDQAALDAFNQARYTPARLDGQPVRTFLCSWLSSSAATR